MVNNPHLSDVQFQVDSGDVLFAHLFVLYARCPAAAQAVSAAAVPSAPSAQESPDCPLPLPASAPKQHRALLGLMATASGPAVVFQLRKPE